MKRQKHSLSHYKLATMDMGQLVPVAVFEALPGDSIQQATSALVRVSPMLAPVMHPVQVRLHHWFVPNRLLWSSWENFITGGPDGEDASVPPTIDLDGTNNAAGTILDYMGIPAGNLVGGVSALPVRAYNMIYNDFYRDQDLIVTPVTEDTTTVQQIAWEKDYFTSARPWTQKGDDVTLPLGGIAPIHGIGKDTAVWDPTDQSVYETGTGVTIFSDSQPINPAASNTTFRVEKGVGTSPGIYADLQSATGGANINDIRRAFAIQRYKEARALYGSRYTEYLKYLGISSSDSRLQNAEYLGGGKVTIAFSEILQTGPDTSDEGVGDLKGHGIAAIQTRRYRKYIEEHGIILTLMSVRPRTMYNDGIPKMWSRAVKEDYWQKELEMIGSQPVLNKEIYAAHTNPTGTFGYQERYAEYRHIQSNVAADFRTTLNHFHLGRIFGADPTLNQDFIECDPSKRIHAVQTNDVLWCMISNQIQARRMVTKRAVGRLL